MKVLIPLLSVCTCVVAYTKQELQHMRDCQDMQYGPSSALLSTPFCPMPYNKPAMSADELIPTLAEMDKQPNASWQITYQVRSISEHGLEKLDGFSSMAGPVQHHQILLHDTKANSTQQPLLIELLPHGVIGHFKQGNPSSHVRTLEIPDQVRPRWMASYISEIKNYSYRTLLWNCQKFASGMVAALPKICEHDKDFRNERAPCPRSSITDPLPFVLYNSGEALSVVIVLMVGVVLCVLVACYKCLFKKFISASSNSLSEPFVSSV